jgi:hypothetical protein
MYLCSHPRHAGSVYYKVFARGLAGLFAYCTVCTVCPTCTHTAQPAESLIDAQPHKQSKSPSSWRL